MGTANNITGRVEACGASGIRNMGFKGEELVLGVIVARGNLEKHAYICRTLKMPWISVGCD